MYGNLSHNCESICLVKNAQLKKYLVRRIILQAVKMYAIRSIKAISLTLALLTFASPITAAIAAELPSAAELDFRSASAIEIRASVGQGIGARDSVSGDIANMRSLAYGDFLYRFGLDDRLGVAYWAYNGDTREVIAAISPQTRLAGVEDALRIFVSLTKMPNRLTCGNDGRSHIAFLALMPEVVLDKLGRYEPRGADVIYSGIVRNDKIGQEPVRIYEFHTGSRKM